MNIKSVSLVVIAILVVAGGFGAGTWYAHRIVPRSASEEMDAVYLFDSLPIPTSGLPRGAKPIFLVSLEGSGTTADYAAEPKIGCGDRLVSVTSPASNVQDALSALLAIKKPQAFYGKGELYSALAFSTLRIDRVSPEGIYLSGSFQLGGVCDNPRVEEQINATVHQFPGYETAAVYVNNKTLKDALSLK